MCSSKFFFSTVYSFCILSIEKIYYHLCKVAKLSPKKEPYEFDVKTYAASVHLALKHTVNYFFAQYK